MSQKPKQSKPKQNGVAVNFGVASNLFPVAFTNGVLNAISTSIPVPAEDVNSPVKLNSASSGIVKYPQPVNVETRL